jgi:cellobiose dehydrogenase (acceptor)
MAGCVLGGGVAVNAGLWWKPYPDDWDANFPAGWKSTDVAAATERVFKRIPGTSTPSMDGRRYEQEGFEALAVGFNKAGWQGFEDANVDPTSKNHTYARTTFMFSGGERGGPLATYLVTASERKGFTLWTDTNVNRVVRQGGHISGVEVQCTATGGKTGTINVTPGTGRVILSAGTFGSAKLLMRSKFARRPGLKKVAD